MTIIHFLEGVFFGFGLSGVLPLLAALFLGVLGRVILGALDPASEGAAAAAAAVAAPPVAAPGALGSPVPAARRTGAAPSTSSSGCPWAAQ